jgi:signal transduction histidine kinase
MTYFKKNPWSFGDSSPLQWTQALFRIVAVLCALFVFGTNSVYSQSSPPNSDQAKRVQMLVDRAAELVNTKGKEAFSEFRQRGSEWFSGDTYIFAYAPDGTVVLNPAFPAREGRAYHGEKDKKGKAFHDEIIKTAQTKGSGWVDYWLPKPGQSEPSQKWSYVKAVKAEGVAVVGAGFFPE